MSLCDWVRSPEVGVVIGTRGDQDRALEHPDVKRGRKEGTGEEKVMEPPV